MLLIGISACLMYPDMGRPAFGPKTLLYLESDMAVYLCRPGVVPVLIPDLPEEALWPLLEKMDGFVFQGGVDLAPESYGEEPIGSWKGDAYRDAYELRLIDFAMQRKKPILAICRGMQLMNVYFGGTLYQDIPTQYPTHTEHRHAEVYDRLTHEVVFPKGSFLAPFYAPRKRKMVNTVHHQAVKKLGKDLEVLAFSKDDGIIEAVMYRHAAPGKVLGVQWHPEFSHTMGGLLLDGDILVENFLAHCSEKAG